MDVIVSAKKLYQDYQANEVRADAKYKGKRIGCAGRVESIDKDILGNVMLKLSAGERFSSVNASLQDSETDRALEMSKGDVVRLYCIGGTMIIGTPTLDKCLVINEEDLKGE